jgi:twitching motility protein PilU
VHRHKKCIVNQREVGVDTRSFHNALINTLRQAPDVILIGEVRNRETMEHALAFAETGHLAISTLHANNANQALDRIVNLFPEERRPQLLMNLGQNLRAFVSQRLIPTVEGKRCAAVEVLLGTKTIEELVVKGEFESIKEIMTKSETLGMQTFDAALFKLYKEGRISMDEAIRNADSQNDVRLRIKLDQSDGNLALEDAPGEKKGVSRTSSGLTLSLVEEEKKDEEAPGKPKPHGR